jgi:hypothetical protein
VPRPPQNRASPSPSTRLKQAGQGRSVHRDPSSVATALGPFTAEAASNLSSGSHASPSSSSGSPDPVSTLSGRASARIRPVIQEPRRWRTTGCLVLGFLSPFGAPAFASGSSCPAEELGLPYGRLTGHTIGVIGPQRGFHVPHERATTGAGALSTPRTTVLYRPGMVHRPDACRFPAASPWTPLELPIGGASRNEASSRVHWYSPFRSSPSPVAAGWNSSPWA